MIDPTTGLEVENPSSEPAKTDGSAVDNNQQQKTREQITAELQEKFKDLSAEELLSKLAEKEEIISHKNRAIESLKVKKETVPVSPATEVKPSEVDMKTASEKLVEMALGEIRKATVQESVVKSINSFTNDEAERRAIMDAYNNDIVKSGDAEKDLEKALAIANANFIKEIKKNKSEAEATEMIMTRFSSGQSYGSSKTEDNVLNTPAKKAAAENLRKLGYKEDEIKSAISKI